MKNKKIVLPLIISLFIMLVMLAYNVHYYFYITQDLVKLGISNEKIIKRLDLFYNFASFQLFLFAIFGSLGVSFLLSEVLN